MKNQLFFSLILSTSILQGLLAQAPTELPTNSKQEELLQKNKKKQEEILSKYQDFYKNLQNRYPNLSFSDLPIDITNIKDLKSHNEAPGALDKKLKQIQTKADDSFYLRTEPNSQPEFLSKIKVKKGERLEVVLVLKKDPLSKSDGPNWCLVRTANKKEGYITSDLLTREGPKVSSRNVEFPSLEQGRISIQIPNENVDTTTSTKWSKKNFWVNVSVLNLRNDPDVNSYILAKLPKGEKLEVVYSTSKLDVVEGNESPWHYVSSNFGSGWVFGGYLSSSQISSDSKPGYNDTNYPQENPDELVPGAKRYVRSTTLRLRDEPNEFGSVVTSIPGDETVQIIDVKNSLETIGGIKSKWIYINWNDTWEGWVFGGFVTKEKGQLVLSDDISKYFQIPVDNERYVSSSFGTRIDPVTGKQGAFHSGIDLPAPIGTPIKAVSDGVVWRTITTSGGYGVLTILSHKNNIYTYYAHQNTRKVKEGDRVSPGEVIGEVGNSGKSTGPHLHFEVRKGPSQEALDPDAFLPK